jgi:hypothetical protein
MFIPFPSTKYRTICNTLVVLYRDFQNMDSPNAVTPQMDLETVAAAPEYIQYFVQSTQMTAHFCCPVHCLSDENG